MVAPTVVAAAQVQTCLLPAVSSNQLCLTAGDLICGDLVFQDCVPRTECDCVGGACGRWNLPDVVGSTLPCDPKFTNYLIYWEQVEFCYTEYTCRQESIGVECMDDAECIEDPSVAFYYADYLDESYWFVEPMEECDC